MGLRKTQVEMCMHAKAATRMPFNYDYDLSLSIGKAPRGLSVVSCNP